MQGHIVKRRRISREFRRVSMGNCNPCSQFFNWVPRSSSMVENNWHLYCCAFKIWEIWPQVRLLGLLDCSVLLIVKILPPCKRFMENTRPLLRITPVTVFKLITKVRLKVESEKKECDVYGIWNMSCMKINICNFWLLMKVAERLNKIPIIE